MKRTGYGQQVLLLQCWKSDYYLGSNRAISILEDLTMLKWTKNGISHSNYVANQVISWLVSTKFCSFFLFLQNEISL